MLSTRRKTAFIAEHDLQKLEDIALPILDQLRTRNFTLKPEDRLTFAGYIALAHTRVPAFERFLDHVCTLINAKTTEFIAGDERALASVAAKIGKEKGEQVDPEDFRKKLTGGTVGLTQTNRGWTVMQMFENMMTLQRLIYDMTWSFLLSPPEDDGFLTSDNPVSLFDPLSGPMQGIGFMSSPASHFVFPLCRDLCCWPSTSGPPRSSNLRPLKFDG